MDIELRNQLGALTAQVQELTKQSKALDGTLAGALDKGAKSARGLADSTRSAKTEMTTVEQVSMRVGSMFRSQLYSFAVSSLGITAIWQGVTSAIEKANAKMQAGAKATADFAAGTRSPGDNPAMRSAIREGTRYLTPDDQATALKSYLKAGGTGEPADITRLGRLLDQSVISGLDTAATAGQYATLRQARVANPEDVIARAALEKEDLSKMKSGQLRAYSRQPQTTGSLDRLVAATRLDETDRLQLAQRANLVATQNREASDVGALRRKLAQEIDAGPNAQTPGAYQPLVAEDIARAKSTAEDLDTLRAQARATLQRQAAFKFLVTDAAVERLALQMQTARRNLPDVPGPAGPARVIIDSDARPYPVNGGD